MPLHSAHLEIDDREEGGDGAPPERLEHRSREQDGHEDDLGGGARWARRPSPDGTKIHVTYSVVHPLVVDVLCVLPFNHAC